MIEPLHPSKVPTPPYSSPEGPSKVISLAMRLEEICRARGLFGISAPQVGVPWKLFVYWSNCPSDPKVFSCIVDCECSGSGEKFLSLESCCTFPGDRFGVMRYSDLECSGKLLSSDEQGKVVMESFEGRVFSGLEAAIIQHEFDHTMGVMPDKSGERLHFI